MTARRKQAQGTPQKVSSEDESLDADKLKPEVKPKPETIDMHAMVYGVIAPNGQLVTHPNNPSELFTDKEQAKALAKALGDGLTIHGYRLVRVI